jgi:bile acid:Na+ symporter, BASS family
MPITTLLFPFSAIMLSIIAYFVPTPFLLGVPHISTLLMVAMFGMGLTLSLDDFKRVTTRRYAVLLGMFLQFSIMPLAAFLIATALQLPDELKIGMVLVGSTAGGTASNVICFLAKGDVALSITMTLCSTMLAVFMTPFLTFLFLNQVIDIDVWGMLSSVLQIVALPVAAGTLTNIFLTDKIAKFKPFYPFISMLAIVFIIAIIVALNRTSIADVGSLLLFAVILHNLIGIAGGYSLAKLFKQDERTCRTLAIEVGMQNSGLSVALAMTHFSKAAALPGALFSIWHNISGSILASSWGHFHHVEEREDKEK